jgi:hypothetical protein
MLSDIIRKIVVENNAFLTTFREMRQRVHQPG